MANFEYYQFPYMSDNYGVLIHDTSTGQTAAIDVGDASAYLDALNEKSWSLTHLLVTHHHADHIAGLQAVKAKTNCTVIGPKHHSNINGLDQKVEDGDSFDFGGKSVQVIHTPGHTSDMLNYFIADEKVAFTGDTLFALGCGRLFEGDALTMWNSLGKLKQLPPDTTVYSSHEYTLANAEFAITVDPTNAALQSRIKEIKALRQKNEATVPSLLSDELATNPFLRADNPVIRAHLQMEDASDADVFAEIRQRKDNF